MAPLLEGITFAGLQRKGPGGYIPVAPKPPHNGGGGGGSSSDDGTKPDSGGSTTSSTSGSGGSSSGGGGGGGDYRHKAGARYNKQAANLEVQARALRYALNNSFGSALHAKLADVNQILRQQDKVLMQGYRERLGQLEGSAEDNERAQATQTDAALSNRVREGSNALVEAMTQGAGETDVIRTQLMALRNWQANQSEVERSRFDTLRSINSSLTDLNVDTKSARVGLETQANADKEQLWTNYFNQRSETFTQLGNVLGQQADYRDMAHEMGVGKGGGTKAAGSAFMSASKELGKSWDNPGISRRVRRWDGHDDFAASSTNASKLAAAPTVDLGKAPEGATLRKWTP